jgi:hypothetical protein
MPTALFYFGRTTIWMPVHHELRATTPSPYPNQARPALLLDSFPSSIEIRRTAVRQQRGRRRSAVPEGDFEAPSARRFTDPPAASPPTTPSPTAAPDDECEDGEVVRGLWDTVWQWQATPTTCIRNVHSRAMHSCTEHVTPPMNLPRCPGRPRGPKHVRAACMREPRDPSQQLDMMRPVRSCRKLGHGWDVFGIWMNGRIGFDKISHERLRKGSRPPVKNRARGRLRPSAYA